MTDIVKQERDFLLKREYRLNRLQENPKPEKRNDSSLYIKYAKDFAHNYGVILVLKNAVSIITDGERVILNTTGNSSLAKCGSGDILSGIIAGISARISDILLAVASGCYVLGKSAEEASKVFGEYSTTATEIIENIYKVIT